MSGEQALLDAAALRAAGRWAAAPSAVALADGDALIVDKWLRILPGKRLTGIARWHGRAVLAKLFVARRGSERHWQRECQGLDNLARHALPAPGLLASGQLPGGGYFVLIEYLDNTRRPDAASIADLAPVFEMLGRMHAQGLLQEDAHLGNFLLQEGALRVIDGGAIQPAASAHARLDNLAMLFAQLTLAVEHALRADLLAAYRAGHPEAALDAAQLRAAVDRAREARLADYLDKCLRDCSLFKVSRRIDRFYSLVRSETDFLAPLIADPDAWLEQGIALKRGRTATVARIELQGRALVIKRYNIKSAGHALSRLWRPSRAWHSWLAAHHLRLLGIATPRPLALIEQRLGPLRGRAWLITEYCAGPNLQDTLAAREEENAPGETLHAVHSLFTQLAAARISHGDLKATNFILSGHELCVLDLDAMKRHATEAGWRAAWRKDRARFLRNWPAGSVLRQEMAAALPPA